ncbi:O-succinylbenzoic acid--CoA ligase [Algoriphagus sp. 4150]|uniref:AMP-binding protein n=1 Tax=Algoriphagus sp. 4150 TaxID=2817756 RepID=UPI0028552629|nr:AMP-binding protein [Algoriphagus sp. 4150]MDR7131400.1 O-succinylbenzoic acid--CoA ligase [Algoriphagus sp. 4150]
MFQLIFDNHALITKEDFETTPDDFPDYAKAAVQFCREWLSGKTIFVQQTSGSTGTPKKMEITQAQMIASAKSTQAFFKTDEASTLLCCLDPGYIAGKMMLVRAMVWNCSIQLIEPKSNPLLEVSAIPDFVAMVPLQVEASLKNKSSLVKLKQIKHLIIGGAPLNTGLKHQLIASDIRAYQTYGMTETVSHVALAKIVPGELIYSMLPGVEFGLNERNALWVKSELSNNQLVQTNDLVELIDKDLFRWLGRADFVINSGGVKLHPELLEAKAERLIHSFYPNSAFFFFGIEDEKLGEKLCLAIESKDSAVNENTLTNRLKMELGKYELPKNIFVIPEFSRTGSGKVNRLKTIELL